MGKHESDVILKFKMDGQVQYAQTIKDINQTMNTAAKEYKNHVSAMGNDATATAKLTAEKKKLQIQVEGAEKRTKLLREEYEKSVKATGENSKESKKLYDRLLQAETAENNLKNSLEKTTDALKEQGDVSISTAEKIKKIEEAGDKVKGVGSNLTKLVTLPIMAIGAASIKSFDEVDEGMDTVTAKTGATGKELEALGQSFRKVAANAPDEFLDVGKAVGEINTRLGFTGEQLEKASDEFLKFASVNGTDVEGAIISVTRAMGDAGIGADQYSNVLDLLTVAGQKSGISVDKLAENLAKYGAPMRALGIDTKTSIAMFSGWEKAGVNTEIAFSGMKKAISNWGKEGKDSGEEFKKTMQQIKDAPSIAEATTLSIEAFGAKAGPDLADAIKGGRFEVDEYIEALENAGGALDQTFDDMQDPPDQAKIAFNNIKLILNDIGETILGALAPALKEVTGLLQRFQEWFNQLSPGAKQTIVIIGGIIAAIGPLIFIVGTLMGSMTKIAAGFQVLAAVIGFVTSPIGLIILAIVGLIAIFAVLWTKCEWFRNFWKETWEFAKSWVDGIVTSVLGVFKTFIDTFVTYFSTIFDTIKGVFDGVITFLTGVFSGNWKQAWEGIVDIFSSIISGIGNMFKIPINFMIGLLNSFIAGINKIKLPKWVPGIGGKGISIPLIPQLAKGGNLLNGQAIVGEAGPELLTQKGSKTTVTPLSPDEKSRGIGGNLKGSTKVYQTVNIGQVDANNPSEHFRLNRTMYDASKLALNGLGGV